MVTKIGPPDPATQFICSSCGRAFNQDLREEFGGRELCVNCFSEQPGSPAPTLLEEKILNRKRAALERAQKEFADAQDAFLKARGQEAVQLPEGKPEVADPDDDEDDVDDVEVVSSEPVVS